MKKYIIVFLLIVPWTLSADIDYPESLYIVHKETGYKLLLGSAPNFVKNFFGDPIEDKVLFRLESPDYKIRECVYPDFVIRYQTFDLIIMTISVSSHAFRTSKDIEIGSSSREVTSAYGVPVDIFEREGFSLLCYEKKIDEINLDGEYTQLIFKMKDGFVSEIIMTITSIV